MKEFKLRAPFAWPEGSAPSSGYSKLVAALGVMTGGGMIVEGKRLNFSNDDFSLSALQMILIEAGCELNVRGAAPANDGGSTFVAMSDGSVWRSSSAVESDGVTTHMRKCPEEEVTADCAQVHSFADAMRAMVYAELVERQHILEGDVVQGRINGNGHAAICMSAKGDGWFVVFEGETQKVRGGYEFVMEAKPLASYAEAKKGLKIKTLGPSEIQFHLELLKNAMGIDGSNPFPQKMGLA